MDLWDSIKQLFRRGPAADPDEEPLKLLKHFMFQLGDEFYYAQYPTNELPVVNAKITERVQELLDLKDAPLTWTRLYQIERLLVYIRPRSRLENETDRRVAEMQRHNLASASKYRAQLDKVGSASAAAREAADKAAAAAASPPQGATEPDKEKLKADLVAASAFVDQVESNADNSRRAILASALDDLQWFYQQRILKRKALWASAKKLLVFGVICVLIVSLPFIAFVLGKVTNTTKLLNLIKEFPNYGLFTAMSFGLLGAFFSRLISLQFSSDMTVEEAENRYGFKSLAIRAGVGMCGAVIIYFLLGTNLLGQTAKPDFTKLEYQVLPVVTMLSADPISVLLPSPDWCLLIIWSFLAGFSERLVPDTLSRAEGQLSGQQK